MNATPPLRKLLAHRLRGFAGGDHSLAAFRLAGELPVAYLEVDTRATADGALFATHDATFTDAAGRRRRLADADADVAAAGTAKGVPLVRLADGLAALAGSMRADQTLCLDVKDYGFEAEHLGLVRDLGLEDRTTFLSWIPQSLLRLRALGTTRPMILAHVNLHRLGAAGRGIAGLMASRRLCIGHFVLFGNGAITDLPAGLHKGRQFSLVSDVLNAALLDCLVGSGGGICVQTPLLDGSLQSFCRARGLRLWVFATTGVRSFLRYAEQEAVDVVFADDSADVGRALL